MLLAEFAHQRFGLRITREHAREQELVFLGMVKTVEKAIDIGQQAVKNGEVRMLASLDLGDELVETVQNRTEIPMFVTNGFD